VGPKVRERDSCVRRDHGLARRSSALDRLGEHRIRAIQLTLLAQRSTEGRKDAQATRVVDGEQGCCPLEQVHRRP